MPPGAETFRTSADAYEKFVGRYGPTLARGLLDFAGAESGMSALDVGCGPGALTTALVESLGAKNVKAVDPSEPFVEACASKHPGVDVREAPAEQLPFEDGEFDLALSQLVINFMAEPVSGVAEMARVTRQGGTVASCVWDYSGEMTLLRAYWDAALEVDPDGAAARDEGVAMPWCREGELGDLFRAAGLSSVRDGSIHASARFESFDELWWPLTVGVGPSGAYCKSLEEPVRAELRNGFQRRLGAGDMPFEVPARAWVASGIAS